MSAIVEAAAALAQGVAEVLPLPDSRSSTPPSEYKNDVEASKSPSCDTENNCGRLSPITKVATVDDSASNSTDVHDKAPDAVHAHVKHASNKPFCAELSHDSYPPNDRFMGTTVGATDQTTPDESYPVSIKSESTDNLNGARGYNTNSNINPAADPAAGQWGNVSLKPEAMGSTCKSEDRIEESSAKSAESAEPEDVKCLDRFDTANSGDVVRHFFTRGTRQRALSPVQEDRTYQLAASSDLWVKIKSADGPDFVFEVDSAALAAHSPIFSTMAYDTHTRGNQEEWVWELEGDSITGLSVMFSLLHLDTRGRIFNQEPSAREVYDVLRVFSKYQIPQAAFYTWMKKWTEGFRNGMEAATLRKVECLYAAYKLGDFRTLKSCIRHVAHEIEINADGAVRLADGRLIQEALPMTDDLVDNILAIRTADLKNLLQPFQEAHDFFMDAANLEGTKFCKSIDSHGPCNQKLLGSLLQSLIQQQLYPIPAVASYVGSVGRLAKKVSEMNVHGLVLPGLAPHKQRHGNCKLGQDAVAKKIMENAAYLPLSEHLVEHMYRAAKDLGVHRIEQSEFHVYKDMFNKWKNCDDSWLSDDDSGVYDPRGDDVSSTRKASQ